MVELTDAIRHDIFHINPQDHLTLRQYSGIILKYQLTRLSVLTCPCSRNQRFLYGAHRYARSTKSIVRT